MRPACLLRTTFLAAAALALTAVCACGSDNAETPATTDQPDAATQEETSAPAPDAAEDDVAPGDDAAVDAAEEPAVGDAADEGTAVAKCKNEVDLSKQTLPCDCYGTIVSDAAEAMPSCTLTVVCCPSIPGLKCE